MTTKFLYFFLFTFLYIGIGNAQEVPEHLEFAGLTLKIDQQAKLDIQNRVDMLLEDPEKFQHKVEIADLYMPLITDILEETQLPLDFKYLAVLDNTSPDSLLFWKMAEEAALDLGLKVNEAVDERQNIVASTRSIATYLKENNTELQNWMFTLLSYHLHNDGVKKYVEKYFPGLDIVQIATQKEFEIHKDIHPDVLQFLACSVAFQSALGKNLDIKQELVSYQDVNNKTLQQIAKEFALPASEIKQFNPWLKTETIPDDKAYEVVVPMPSESPTTDVNVYTSSRGEFVYQTSNTAALHTVRRGQTLYAISRLYNVSVTDIRTWNNLSSSSVLNIGQKLVVSRGRKVDTSEEEKVKTTTVIHTVQRGDNLYRIARKYDVSVRELRSWNTLYTDQLSVGQRLRVNKEVGGGTGTGTGNGGKEYDGNSSDTGSNNTNNTGNSSGIGIRTISKKTVPSEMYVAGVRLKISQRGRAAIQKDVDLLTRNQKYFLDKLYRVDLYMPLVEETLRKEGLPSDFKYLPIQESALIGNAVSRSKAVGYWQFKATSAKEVGMEVSNRIDERMNIVGATTGAAKYLKRNNLYYKNWVMALLSYNMGFTGAKNHMARAYRGKNMRNAREITITDKTHWYIRKFLAHKIAFEPEIGVDRLNKKLISYKKGSQKTLKQVAIDMGSNENDMKPHNYWLKKSKIPGDKIYTVIVPLKSN